MKYRNEAIVAVSLGLNKTHSGFDSYLDQDTQSHWDSLSLY